MEKCTCKKRKNDKVRVIFDFFGIQSHSYKIPSDWVNRYAAAVFPSPSVITNSIEAMEYVACPDRKAVFGYQGRKAQGYGGDILLMELLTDQGVAQNIDIDTQILLKKQEEVMRLAFVDELTSIKANDEFSLRKAIYKLSLKYSK